MNAHKNSPVIRKGKPKSVLDKSKNYPFKVSLFSWFFLFAIIAFSLYEAAKSFISAGRTWPLILIILLSLWFIWTYIDMQERKQRAIFLDSYSFPSAIMTEVIKRYPHLGEDELQFVLQGLRQYFQLCNSAPLQAVSMPSRVVDVAWHEFILMTYSYAQFCDSGLGSFLHHIPAAEMNSPDSAKKGLKIAWFHACQWEGIDQASPSRLPLLFAIDNALNIPDGFKHPLNNDYVSNASEIGEKGCAGGCGGCGGGADTHQFFQLFFPALPVTSVKTRSIDSQALQIPSDHREGFPYQSADACSELIICAWISR